MAHPTRTGDLVVFSSPPYQFDAATPGTLIARSAFFGQHGYLPDIGATADPASNTNVRATFLAGGRAIARGGIEGMRSIDVAATASFLLDIPVPQHSQGQVITPLLRGDNRYKVLNLIGLNDFHGQLEAVTTPIDGRNVSVGGAAALATMFDEEAAVLPGDTLLLAAGDNVGASPPNSALLDDRPAIDVENAWGMDATAYGNHEFDFGVERILEHLDRADFPFLSSNIVEIDTGRPPPWMDRSAVFNVNGVRVGVIGATGAGARRCHRRSRLLGGGQGHRAGVGSAAAPRGPGAGRGHPRGRRARQQPRRLDRAQPVAGPDHRHR
jgi:hypothetical protein